MASIRVVRDLDGFQELRPLWEAMVTSNPEARIFQTFEWNYQNWIIYHKELFPNDMLFIIHAVRDGHCEEAIFPFLLRKGQLLFIGGVCADRCDVICRPHSENWHEFYSDVAKFIRESDEVKSVSLVKIPAESEILSYFGAYLPFAEIRKQYGYSFLHLHKADEVSESFVHLTSKERSYIRSLARKLKSSTFLYKNYSVSTGDRFPEKEIACLQKEMVEKQIRNTAANQDAVLHLMAELYKVGLCDVSTICNSHGEFELASYRLKNGTNYNFWMVLYRDRHLVTSSDVQYIAEALQKESCLFDWGLGTYSYKLGTFRPIVSNLFTLESKRYRLWDVYKELKLILKKVIQTNRSSPWG